MTSGLARTLSITLAGATVAVLLLVAVVRREAQGPLFGTWIGRDSTGAEVGYRFGAAGSGFRVVGDPHEELRYVLVRGYPNEIDLHVVSNGDTALYRGLVEFVDAEHFRLEHRRRTRAAPPERVCNEPQRVTNAMKTDAGGRHGRAAA